MAKTKTKKIMVALILSDCMSFRFQKLFISYDDSDFSRARCLHLNKPFGITLPPAAFLRAGMGSAV